VKKKSNSRRKKRSSPSDEKSLSGAYTTDLKDRESVRTTFKISTLSAETIKVLAKHHGIRFKEVFDNLCAQFLKERLMEKISDKSELDQAPLLQQLAYLVEQQIAQKPDQYNEQKKDLVRKSQVVSRGALRTLNEVSKEYKIPRDLLVDWSLAIMRTRFDDDIETTQEQYEQAEEMIAGFIATGNRLYDDLDDLLEANDPLLARFDYPMIMLDNLLLAIKAYLKDGTPIDPDDFGQAG
jgi:hypothetical protein